MKRRAAIEPVIGHVKAEHRMQRNYLKGCHGDHANAVLRSEEHTSELQSLMRQPYDVFCLKKKKARSQKAGRGSKKEITISTVNQRLPSDKMRTTKHRTNTTHTTTNRNTTSG